MSRLPLILTLTLCSCASPNRMARSVSVSAWTATGTSGTVSRLTPSGSVGNAGEFDSDDVYGVAVTIDVDKMLGPEPQPIYMDRPAPEPIRDPVGWGLEPGEGAGPPVAEDSPEDPSGVPAWLLWTLGAGLPGVLALLEGLSRLRGGKGLVGPAAAEARRALMPKDPKAG